MTATIGRGEAISRLGTDPFGAVVGGRSRHDGTALPVLDPSTGATIGTWYPSTPRDVDDALRTARLTHDEGTWRRLPPARRAELLDRVAADIEAAAPELAAFESLDTGKSIHGASTFDLYEAAAAFAHAAAVCRTAAGDVRRTSYPPALYPGDGPEIVTMRLHEPVGVVVELLPWNAPLMTGSQRLAAGLAAGCCVVVKPPEEAVVTASHLVRLLHAAGVPTGAVQLVLGAGETVGEQLVTDSRVDLVSLTGSAATGRRVMELASRHLTAVHLELGGKAPMIVCADADLDRAVTWAAMASFVNAGQVCVAGSRLLVERSVHDEVVQGVVELARQFRIGDALDSDTFMGPLVTAEHAANVRGFRDRALAAGDAIAVGGAELPDGLPPTFVAPVVLGAVRPGSELEQQEIFGPVLAAMPFDADDEAVALANGTSYGLNATVFTSRIDRAFQLADRLVVGEVNVNCHFTPNMNAAKGEPRKQSGLGAADVAAYTTRKAINLNITP
jgi:acyl-CoA reductase-like NAD-dependent aldehyde dehydrogenase